MDAKEFLKEKGLLDGSIMFSYTIPNLMTEFAKAYADQQMPSYTKHKTKFLKHMKENAVKIYKHSYKRDLSIEAYMEGVKDTWMELKGWLKSLPKQEKEGCNTCRFKTIPHSFSCSNCEDYSNYRGYSERIEQPTQEQEKSNQ